MNKQKPLILITGAAGKIGQSLCTALKNEYKIIGLDIRPCEEADMSYEIDLTSKESVQLALHKIKNDHGSKIAAVVHLAAYFDFTGEDHPLYQKVNIDGTKHLLQTLQEFDVERFIYASTMLVHEAGVPGQKVSEDDAIQPSWAYPKSKARAEKVIHEEHGQIPFTILRLAGLYDENTAVPTLSQQIARIYEKDFKSRLYSGDLMAGQAFIHKDDMTALFKQTIEARTNLPDKNIMLAGEDTVMGYQALQNRIGGLIYGDEEWDTFTVPELIAKTGAWAQEISEPVVPDAIDQGQPPFIRPFMIDLASDHYHLDTSRVEDYLGWQAKHNIYEGLETLVENLKSNPAKWYENNNIIPPDWIKGAREKDKNAHHLREAHKKNYRFEHAQNIWAHFLNIGLAFWLLTAPFILGYEDQAMQTSNIVSGIVLAIFASLSLSWRMGIMRWGAGLIGLWLLAAPLLFWTPSAAAYLNDTIIGMLVLGFAICSRPSPGVSPVAAETGPTTPPGWQFSPSSWFQRIPIIILAFIGFFISRYLCAYQLGHIDGIWEPFFAGSAQDPQNGTEEIITSFVSEAWPVPDAGLGAMTYALEIITGIIGSSRRWRTMPWLVMLFGLMIVPLGAVSIFFIIIQPILLGTWCTLCLIAAAAMLIQIPYSLDELVATSEFLYRRVKKGRPFLLIFFKGDTDEGPDEKKADSFEQSPVAIIKEMLTGGVTIPWNLALCFLIGLWLMFTRLSLGTTGSFANADHLIGSLVLTLVVTVFAETARAGRFLLIPLGATLFITPFIYTAGLSAMISSFICGALLILLSFPKGKIKNTYGLWNKAII